MAEFGVNDSNEISDIHSFVVRIWLEEMESETHRLVWHGHIKYVRNGDLRYINTLNEIPEFIQTHLHLHGESDS